jgi:glutamine amidotransferase
MQLMASRGTEGGETEGLGWVQADVQRLKPTRDETRIPHIGWNEVNFERPSPLFRGIESGKDFYFVHSYHICPASATEILARTPYGHGFVSAIQRESIFGVQFHPEKSQRIGFQLLTNFLGF